MQTFHREFWHAEFSSEKSNTHTRTKRTDGRGLREKEKKREREGRALAGEGNVLLPIFNQLDPNTHTTSQAYFSFYLFSWPSIANRYHVSVRCLTIAAAFCGDHSPNLAVFLFCLRFPTAQRRARNIRRSDVHLFLAFTKISHAGPVIARSVNYTRDADATAIVIDSIDRVVSLQLSPRCGLPAMSKHARNYPSLLPTPYYL